MSHQNTRQKLSTISLALAGLFTCSATAQAEDVIYDGSNAALLQSVQGETSAFDTNSLGPGSNDAGINSVSASGNNVTITGTSPNAIDGFVYGAFQQASAVSQNTVTMSAGTVARSLIGGFNRTTGGVSGNTVTLNGGTVGQNVTGGRSVSGDVFGNTVIVNKGNVTKDAAGGSTNDGDAYNNVVAILGGRIEKGVLGGYSEKKSAYGNTVTIAGNSHVEKNVHGAYCDNNSCSATKNTVIIQGQPTFGATTVIAGGDNWSRVNTRTGNTLQMHTKGITAANISNFEYLHFYLPKSITSNATVLTLTDAVDIKSPANQPTTKIGVAIAADAAPLKAGDRINLIHTNAGLTADANLVNNTSGMQAAQGISLRYGFDLHTDPNNLYLAVAKAETNPQTKSLSEGRLADLAFVNQGADLLSNAGIASAMEAAQSEKHLFVVVSGSDLRYKSGSHVDVKGTSLLTGASAYLPNSSGRMMLTGFVEAGWGNYDSFNSFADAAGVNASGDTSYYGAGILARQDFNNKFYTEGSIRLGKLDTDYSGTIADVAVNYKHDKAYYGAHLGAGYVLPVKGGELDLYGKYLWTHQNGANHTIAGDVYTFDDINSQRTRLGARYSYPINANANAQFRIGAAWEYEFDAKAKASVHNLPIATPEIKGSTGVLDVGFKVSPASNKNLSFEAGIQGYTGKRKGVTGNVAVKYLF